MIKKLLLVVVLIVGVLTISSAVSAAPIDINGTATSSQIQGQINDAPVGETIQFTQNAIYNNTSLTIDKSITLNGRGATLKANGNTSIFTVAPGTDPSIFKNIVIANFTLEGRNGISVRPGATNITFEDIDLKGIDTTNGTAISIGRGGANGLVVKNVNVTGFYDAFSAGGGNNTTITGCYFHDNGRNAISIYSTITNTTVSNNNLDNCSFGIFFGGEVEGVVVSGNNITNMSCQGLALIKSANTVSIINNRIQFNQLGIIIKSEDIYHDFNNPSYVNKIFIDGNNITDNWLMGIFFQNLPESIFGTDKLILTDNNKIINNGIGYKDDYYDNQAGSNWENEINNTLNIVKNYWKDNSAPVVTPPETKTVTVTNTVTVTKTIVKDVIINHIVKASKSKIKKGKTITVSVKLTNFGKDKSNILKIYNKYSKKTLNAILGGKNSKTLKFKVKINKKGINKIPIYLNGKLISTLKVRGL